jgi:hypothetical protein
LSEASKKIRALEWLLLFRSGTADPVVKSDWQRAVQRAMTEGDAGLAFRIVKEKES